MQLYAVAERLDLTNQEDERVVFSLLDREEDRLTGGVRFRSPRGWVVGVGFEDSTVEFADNARDLSHSGESTLAEVGFLGNSFSFRLALAFRDLEADPGSDFGTFDETTGNLETLWNVSPKTSFLTYAWRRQRFSVASQNAFVLSERQGARLDYAFQKSGLALIAEVGEDEFEAVGTGLGDRIDDVTAFGLEYRLRLRELVSVVAQVIYNDYDSNLDGFDRDVTRFGLTIQLKDLADKLRLGQANEDW